MIDNDCSSQSPVHGRSGYKTVTISSRVIKGDKLSRIYMAVVAASVAYMVVVGHGYWCYFASFVIRFESNYTIRIKSSREGGGANETSSLTART